MVRLPPEMRACSRDWRWALRLAWVTTSELTAIAVARDPGDEFAGAAGGAAGGAACSAGASWANAAEAPPNEPSDRPAKRSATTPFLSRRLCGWMQSFELFIATL